MDMMQPYILSMFYLSVRFSYVSRRPTLLLLCLANPYCDTQTDMILTLFLERHAVGFR